MIMKSFTGTMFIATVLSLLSLVLPVYTAEGQTDGSEFFESSLVYIEAAEHKYDPYRPWRHANLVQNKFYGCAVGDYQVLTTAYGVTDAVHINVRQYGQNEFIPAKVNTIDYESNLCLLDLDPSAMDKPLKAVTFSEDFEEGVEVDFYWLSSSGHLLSGRGYTDRARMTKSVLSYAKFLNYIISNTSSSSSNAELYTQGLKPIGLACWSNDTNQAGLICGNVINKFLAGASGGPYKGFATVGFATDKLLDPTLRTYLKLPDSLKHGVYVKDVYHLGTGNKALKKEDVILTIDGYELDAYGRFDHPQFKQLSFEFLITSRGVGDDILFDVWRDGKAQQLHVKAQNFQASEMMIPYYEYDRKPEYMVMGGFLFQRLTLDYLQVWGNDWAGRVSAHLTQYYREFAFKPTAERREIVILSRVMPAEINQGYQNLRQLVVKTFNGMPIASIDDLLTAQRLQPESEFDVLEFENDNPVVVISRAQREQADAFISSNYGIGQLVYIEQ